MEHDSEHSLGTGENNMVRPLVTQHSGYDPQNRSYFNPHWLHEVPEENPEYRQRFADRVYRHLRNDGVLTAENAIQRIETRADQIDIAVISESVRWGDANRSSPYTKKNWRDAVDDVNEWIAERQTTVINQLKSQGWYPRVEAPQCTVDGQLQHGGLVDSAGQVFLLSAATVTHTALPAQGNDVEVPGPGADQGTAWRNTDFDDSSYFEFDVDIGPLRDGRNVLAVEIHQASRSSSDISFDLELLGGWFDGTNGTIYYTLDGRDPRAVSGDIQPGAIRFDGNPLTLTEKTLLTARTWDEGVWSPVAQAQFLVTEPASAANLAITTAGAGPIHTTIVWPP
jgi:hypothetical protein